MVGIEKGSSMNITDIKTENDLKKYINQQTELMMKDEINNGFNNIQNIKNAIKYFEKL